MEWEQGDETLANLVECSGAENTPIGLHVYLSQNGMVTIRWEEDSWLQMSPLVAEQFVNQVRAVVEEAASDLYESTAD